MRTRTDGIRTTMKRGIGSIMSAMTKLRYGLSAITIAATLAASAAACARDQHSAKKENRQKSEKILPIVGVGNCPNICAKVLECKVGPFDKKDDCEAACDTANDDEVTAKTYDCFAKAQTCTAMKKCLK